MRNVEKHLYRLKRKFFSCQTFVLRLLRIPGLSSNTSPAYSLNKVQCLSDTLGLFLFFFPLTLFFLYEISATDANQTGKCRT